jgi:hypothetical protein
VTVRESGRVGGAALAWCVVALAATNAPAADDGSHGPMVTDRPTEGASPLLVAPGHMQLEGGYRLTDVPDAGASRQRHLAPDLLLRFGVDERLELRTYLPGWVHETGVEGTTGFSDISVGAKLHLAPERGLRPQSALIVEASLPVGAQAVTADYPVPKVLFLASHQLSDTWSVTWNLGPSLNRARVEGRREEALDWNYAVAASAALPGGVTLFAELFGADVDPDLGPRRRNAQAGATWLLGDRFQLDARAGAGLTDEEPDWFIGLGVSLRLPN